jgi:hypothetical protein
MTSQTTLPSFLCSTSAGHKQQQPHPRVAASTAAHQAGEMLYFCIN